MAVAILEAKSEDKHPTSGLDQAKGYLARKRLHVPFVAATNGHLWVLFDSRTGITTTPQPMDSFPTPEALCVLYEDAVGLRLDHELAKPLLAKDRGGEASRRYYQYTAIRATLEKLAKGEKRALLSLATGAGKTWIAVNLLQRIADVDQLRRALFVVDREELRQRALLALQSILGNDAAAASGHNYLDWRSPLRRARCPGPLARRAAHPWQLRHRRLAGGVIRGASVSTCHPCFAQRLAGGSHAMHDSLGGRHTCSGLNECPASPRAADHRRPGESLAAAHSHPTGSAQGTS